MSTSLAYLVFGLLLSACFTLGTLLAPRSDSWNKRGEAGGLLTRVFGEGRRLFATQFFVQADIYFHSGYYPSIFDQQPKPKDSGHMTETEDEHAHGGEASHQEHNPAAPPETRVDPESEHYKAMALKRPRDWVEGFGRHFMVTTHKHLGAGNEREMLPWLKLSAEMDPQRIHTYTVAAFWLRQMGKTQEAEDFLRLGLKNNPESYEILFELGALMEAKKDDFRARNVWRMALKRWQQQEPGKEKPDIVTLEKILVRLANLEERNGNLAAARQYLQLTLKVSSHPADIQRMIDGLGKKP